MRRLLRHSGRVGILAVMAAVLAVGVAKAQAPGGTESAAQRPGRSDPAFSQPSIAPNQITA